MAYSRIKVWIAAEILTASDLNAEHTGHISNENDLNTRLVAEVSARGALETEHDILASNLWNSIDNQVADNRVGQASVKDNTVHTAELKAGAVTEVKCAAALKDPAVDTAGLRTLGTGALQALPGDTALGVPNDDSVTYAKVVDAIIGDIYIGGSNTEESGAPHTTWAKLKELHIGHKGAYRIKFDLKSSALAVARGRIYKNGVGIGTVQTQSNTTWDTKSEDLSGWVAGDLCQVYIQASNAATHVYIRNFKVYCDATRTVWE